MVKKAKIPFKLVISQIMYLFMLSTTIPWRLGRLILCPSHCKENRKQMYSETRLDVTMVFPFPVPFPFQRIYIIANLSFWGIPGQLEHPTVNQV